MTEQEWLDFTSVVRQNEFLFTKGKGRKLQLFLCACCRRAYDLVPERDRQRVSRMGSFFLPEPGVVLSDVWQVARHTVEVAERFADGFVTEGECRKAAEVARIHSQHYGHIAAGAPIPGEDPNYDDAAVKMGSDAASAADCAASILPSAAELSVRVVANSVAYDNEAYYAGAHGSPEVDPAHPHLLARRAERAAQWTLLVDIFGEKRQPRKINSAWRTPNVSAIAQTIYDERRFAELPVLADALEEAGWPSEEILTHLRSGGEHVRGCWALDLALGKE